MTVTRFNTTTGKVNVTLNDSSMEFLLSGEPSINHLFPPSSPFLSSLHLCVISIYFRGPGINQSITKRSHAWEWKLLIGAKDGCISSHGMTDKLLTEVFTHLLDCFLIFPCLFLPCSQRHANVSLASSIKAFMLVILLACGPEERLRRNFFLDLWMKWFDFIYQGSCWPQNSSWPCYWIKKLITVC